MPKRSVFLAVLLTVVPVFLYSSNLKATNGNGCINCHTDGEQLKKLCKLPEIGGEGEG
ncbi:MAG TPA: hypothetical protein PLR20_11850 [Syntrophales bacterium]|nr:hypothetical protein [Syntrophales bacterium]HOX93989.1 hypothetical protein [Syntrophales bacterium]HPI57046.1 hypothetical protein [Syntrophales bacterium]HPN23824.1 hypothetical protein [Syntrophales bacterium]HQM30033.1 hypothetical protein [Syntrophales bacterium]